MDQHQEGSAHAACSAVLFYYGFELKIQFSTYLKDSNFKYLFSLVCLEVVNKELIFIHSCVSIPSPVKKSWLTFLAHKGVYCGAAAFNLVHLKILILFCVFVFRLSKVSK